MKNIDSPYVERKLQINYNPAVEFQENDFIEIMRIVQEEDLTRIDFGHHASRIYDNGGWVNIHRETFIRPVQTSQQLTLVHAVNIPIAPKRHWYKSERQCLYYTLYFPALPADVAAIDIIEKEAVRPNNYFNFYGVSLEKIARDVIIAPN